MPFPRLPRLAYLALALLFAVASVNLTAPGVLVRMAAESAPDADDDREAEAAALPSARQAVTAECPADRVVSPRPSRTAAGVRVAPAPGVRNPSADSLGSRLRC